MKERRMKERRMKERKMNERRTEERKIKDGRTKESIDRRETWKDKGRVRGTRVAPETEERHKTPKTGERESGREMVMVRGQG